MLIAILAAVVVGTVIGILGRLVLPGRQNVSVLMMILVGVVAALVGTAIARALGLATNDGIGWIELAFQILLAAAVVALVAGRRLRSML